MKIYEGRTRKFLDDIIIIYTVNNKKYIDGYTLRFILNVQNVYQYNLDGTIKIPYNELFQSYKAPRNSYMRNNKIDSKAQSGYHVSRKWVYYLPSVLEQLRKSRQEKNLKEQKIKELERIIGVVR